MKQLNLSININVLTFDELSEPQQQLVTLARQATHRSYAPYSQFRVGAAILLSNGEIVTGANQENVAYPSGLCAERTACFYAHARYPEATFEMIAIAARGTDGLELSTPISPCGACRQSLLEYENLAGKEVPVLLVSTTDIYLLPSIRSLLPLAFSEF